MPQAIPLNLGKPPKPLAYIGGDPIFSLEWMILSQDPQAFTEVKPSQPRSFT